MPTPLDFGCDQPAPLDHVLPAHNLRLALHLRHWISENAKTTRAFIKRVMELSPVLQTASHDLPSMQERMIIELPRLIHKKGDLQAVQSGFDATPLLQPALQGHDIALVSEAGMPAVADPGSSVVAAAMALGIEVMPLAGPSALLLAMAASGFGGQSFAFVGYLPQEAMARQQRIRELESMVHKTGQTQLFIETPYRNGPLHQALVQSLQPRTRLLCASGLTLATQRIEQHSIKEWREHKKGWSCDQPCVFAIGV
jgi:16S rRNA (cytidine1402-2'-O)-methyltransferase